MKNFKGFKNIKKLILIVTTFVFIIIAETVCFGKSIEQKDFLKTQDKVLRNNYGMGSKIVLRGVNAGGWLLQELWMCPTQYSDGVQDQKTVESTLVKRFGEEKAKELLNTYYDSFWTEKDFDNCADMGMNVIRLPYWYLNIVDANGRLRADAFDRLDWFVEQAGQRGMYVILDMHGAPGSQNDKDHSGDINSNLGLWKGADVSYNQQLFIEVWKMVAQHYKGNPVVAGYDLLNEPSCADGDYTNEQVWNLYDDAYDAIRNIDRDHVIIMEATWEPYNLPNPTKYKWQNVMYEYHSYNYDQQLDANAQLASVNRKIKLINQMNYNVPSYIGETSFFGNMESWEKCLSALNNAGISWTLWSYKVTGDGTNTWGLYNMNITGANLESDSFDTIKSRWQASVTDNRYINSQVVNIVNRFISYSSTQVIIGNAAVSGVPNQTYTGRAITPDVTVKYGNDILAKGYDYTLQYSNNVECGTATITIVGKGGYEGIKKVTFKIVPEAVKNFLASSQTTKTLNLKWNKSYNAKGYCVYQLKKGQYVQILSLKPYYSSYKIKKLKAGIVYKFKICSYTIIDGKKYYGKASYLSTATKVSTTFLKAKAGKNKIKISWKKLAGAKGYDVYCSSSKKGKYKRIKNINSGKKKSMTYRVKKSGTYFLKIKGYSKINGKKVYGKFSKPLKVRVK